jgi:GDPmannose 4,6-dehydratase
MKTAVVTGITGQTGSYIADQLLAQGIKVTGVIRRSSNFNTQRIEHINNNLERVYGDVADSTFVTSLVADLKPDYFYNMAAQSHVRVSFDIPDYTCDVTALGVIRCLEAIRKHSPKTRFYQASSSEMFGASPPPQNELTPFHPRSPYACAKVFGYHTTVNYREAYNIFAVNGILFNHESERRGETFVTRKITRAVGRIDKKLQTHVALGNLDAKRDWGHAADFARGIIMMMEHDEPLDFVLATGETHSVREFAEKAFALIGKDYKDFVKTDSVYLRPSEVNCLLGDASKAKEILGWVPKIKFNELVQRMVGYDLMLAEQEAMIARNARTTLPDR